MHVAPFDMAMIVHFLFALVCAALAAAAIGEAAFRLALHRAASRITMWIEIAFEIAVAAAGIAGTVLLLTHHHPKEMLHVLYGLIAFGAIPVGDVIAMEYADGKKAAMRLIMGVVALGVIVRLFMTG